MKTIKISELIKVLEVYKKELGDMPVIHQMDPEGNSFGTITKDSVGWGKTQLGNTLFIFPFEENVEEELF